MSAVQDTRRRVAIRRDGKEFTVGNSDLGVIFRHHNLDALRKACIWLHWDIESIDLFDSSTGAHIDDSVLG
jgi:hypothetical protein